MRQVIKLLFIIAIVSGLSFYGLKVTTSNKPLQGYIEGDLVTITVPNPGILIKLVVTKGAVVTKGERLFIIDSAQEEALVKEAHALLQKAKDNLANLLMGKRTEELQVIEQQIQQAESEFNYAKVHYERLQKLVGTSFVNEDDLDKSYHEYLRAQNRVAELNSSIVVAKLPARTPEISQAKAEVARQEALVADRLWALEQKNGLSPCDAQVMDTYYVEGERIMSNIPILTLLPRQNKKVRFYIPQALLATIKLEQKIRIMCDGCKQPIVAKIKYIAHQAEYTPPFIYSQENRAKFVFLVEGYFVDDASSLHPGQPVDIRLD